MYPTTFNYQRAEDIDHAIELLDEYANEEIELLAGGHSLVPLMKSGLTNIDTVIDIGRLDDVRGIEEDSDTTRIGALTPYVDLVEHTGLRENATVIPDAAEEIGDVQVRSMGTIGGNVAHADPASDLPAALLASDARLHVRGPDGRRQIDADDFFHGIFTTALEPSELITWIEVPNRGRNDGGAYVKKPSPSSGYALIGVAAVLQTDGAAIQSARIAVNGVMDHAVRLTSVEAALDGAPLTPDSLAEAAEHAGERLSQNHVMDDQQASSEYRMGLLPAYTKRALAAAHERIA